MKILKPFLLLLTILSLHSCKQSNSNYESDDEISSFYNDDDGYSDNTYCAKVEYYNSNTGTRSTYTLNVEVENNDVTVIHFPNGGWLDDDHFYPEALDSNGYCSFTSDKGYEYTVQITGSACSFTDESKMRDNVEEDKEAITCPECGDDKSEYDDYCDSCKHKKENICSRCGFTEYYVNGGLCQNCKDDDEEQNNQ
jgi:hypothetical protein